MLPETQSTADSSIKGRFSEGVEQLPPTPEKTVEGSFSDGMEELPETPPNQSARGS
jgi:hypothetical protein